MLVVVFLALSYVPNLRLIIIQGLLNGNRFPFYAEPLVLSCLCSVSLVKFMSHCGIYLLSLLAQAPLESWRCPFWILSVILCLFVIGFFCDLTEYQAAILHLKREHKEEIENLQVHLFESIELVVWGWFLVYSCAKVNISLLKAYLPRQHLQLTPASGHQVHPGEESLGLCF